MTKLFFGAAVALAGASLFCATPASAEIQLKAACDGKWVEKTGTGFDSYKVCERQAPASPKLGALRIRAHAHKRVAHAKAHKHLAAQTPSPDAAPRLVVASAAPAPVKRDTECMALNCPQFLLIGIGY